MFFPNLIATTIFIEMIRNVTGSSFLVAGGPYTHHCPKPELLNISLMGATFNHFGTILKFNTANSKVRGNTLCCHYAIGILPDQQESKFTKELLDNDFGPITDTRDWGKAFVRVACGQERIGFICMHHAKETSELVNSKEWKWFPEENKYGPVN